MVSMMPRSEAPATIRALRDDEQDVLARATVGNVNWSEPRFMFEQVVQTPALERYFTTWPAPGDFGLVAELEAQVAIAVAWLHHFPAAEPGYGFVDESIPELSIWVAAEHRGLGLGTRVLTELIKQARQRDLPGISLSVEPGNPARRLYERVGFLPAGRGFDAGTLVLRF